MLMNKKYFLFGSILIILILIIVYRFYKYTLLTKLEPFENLEQASSEVEALKERSKQIKINNAFVICHQKQLNIH